jgi:hypothetical protein
MSETEKLQAAIARVGARLSKAQIDNRKRGTQDHWFTLSFLIGIILCSAASAVSGIIYKMPQLTGILGVMPGCIAIAANMLKLQGKANWHDRKANAAGRLLARLFDENLHPTEKDVRDISREWSEIEATMQKDWERLFPISFAEFHRA